MQPYRITLTIVLSFLIACASTPDAVETNDETKTEKQSTEKTEHDDSYAPGSELEKETTETSENTEAEKDEFSETTSNGSDNSNSPTTYAKIPLDENGKPKALTMEETVHMVLDNNTLVRIQQLEILKSDTDLLKEESKYAPVIDGGYEGYVKKDKETAGAIFTGTQSTQDKYYAGISKLFETGTYFRTEISDTRQDNNAGEGLAATQNSLLSQLAQPPLHTGAVKVMLSQELVKNSFGYSQRRINQIARNKSAIQRETLTYQLSGLVVQTMVDYWTLAISEEAVKTNELLLANTKNIRAITVNKMNLGLAEPFEVNQWNALLAQAESQMSASLLERDSKRRSLLRSLNLDPKTPLTGSTQLETKLPTNIDVKKDIEIAYKTRSDFKNIQLQRESAQAAMDLAENAQLPSVSIGGSYSSRDQGRHANSAFNAVPQGKYPEMGVQFKVEYPLWDEGVRVDVRNAKISLRQLSIQEEQLKREISDEITDGYERIKVAHASLKRAEESVEQTAAFYNGLVFRYRQGRFTAVAVKNALDALVQARYGLMQAKINYNITLVRYELSRNKIFEKYNVDVDAVLDKMAR